MLERLLLPAATAGLLTVAGCGDSTGPLGEHELQVQVRTASATSPAASLAAPAPGITAVEIDEAFVVLGSLKLETAGLDQTVDWVFVESVVIDLQLSGSPTLAYDVDVPPGTYKELEISIDKLEVGNPDEDPLVEEHPDLADASILVRGVLTRDGSTETFSFAAPLDIDMELPFAEPLTVTEEEMTTSLVSLVFDPGTWFVDADGMQLDPTDEGDHSAIEAAITASIEVVEDD